MSTNATVLTDKTAEQSVALRAHCAVTKRLGHWTDHREFDVRTSRGTVVMDLRSPQIPAGDIEIEVDIDHATLKLLVSDDAMLDDWDLRRTGRSRVKDAEGPDAPGGRRIVVTGQLRSGEIRVRRGGIAMLSAMFSRAYWDDLRRAHKEGGFPTVDDPARTS